MKDRYTQLEMDIAKQSEDKRKSMQVSVVKEAALGRRVRINVASRKGFTATEVKRHQAAADLAEIVINSLEFKKKLLAKKFSTTSMSSQQVYDKFITGAETLNKETDYEIDVMVTIYEENNSTVGYTYGSTPQTWVNRKFFRQYTLGEIAGNMIHEYCHKLSFDHKSASDHSSVPYSVGYITRDMVADYEKGIRYTDLYPTVVKVPTSSGPVPVVVPAPVQKRVCRRPWYFLFLKEVCLYE